MTITKPTTRSVGDVLSPRQLEQLAVTYATLLGVEIRKWDPDEWDGDWIAFGKAEPNEPTMVPGYWHWGPDPSRYVVATKALAVLGYRLRPNGELYEF